VEALMPEPPTRADVLFQDMLARAAQDPNIVGLYLGGSRGKGAATAESDYDCDIVVRDEVAAEYRARFGGDGAGFNLGVSGLSEFQAYAAIGSAREWDRYNFAHLRAHIDKLDGEIQRIIDDKAAMPANIAATRLPGTLDAYINFTYRSLKNARDGRALAAHLDATEAVNFLLELVFLLHTRLRPYNKYLEWELTHWPLEELPWPAGAFVDLVQAIIRGDGEAQRTVFAGLHPLALRRGLTSTYAGWDRNALALCGLPGQSSEP
jgi:hypothetical protein